MPVKGPLTEPVVELLDLAGQSELGEVPSVDEDIAVGHVDGVGARVRVRDAHEARVARRLGGVVGQRVHPETERQTT